MKKLLYISFAVAPVLFATSCIEEIDPQSSTVSKDQVANAPGSTDKLTAAITSQMTGSPLYGSTPSDYAWDFGYTTTFIWRNVMGQDMVNLDDKTNWYSTWAYCGTGLGPAYAICQAPWTYYYGFIKNCNNVISTIPAEHATGQDKINLGIAHAMRAMFYMDLARMYCPTTYGKDPQALTVPIVTEKTTIAMATNNPQATNEKMFEFILEDLTKAEDELADYKRADVYTPDLSVVYGLKARAYLTMEKWADAEKYAKLAQNGYTPMTGAQYTDRETGFNSPNGAWMFGTTFKSNDPCITQNDGDSSWGSWMVMEITEQGAMGYAANYGVPFHIDRHLYNTIPATDIRKDCFVSFDVPDMSDTEAIEYCREHYSDYPETLVGINQNAGYNYGCGGLSVKFRPAGGDAGHNDVSIGFCVAVPYMRVEEMMLIEAEAAGMQDEGRGINLLTSFAQLRDPYYTYGQHNETYQSDYATAFQNEVWWQRRVEFWGEDVSYWDIKRLQKGIIRSYEGTNHPADTQWNTTTPPQWMTFCFVGTETSYNIAIVQNPTPERPTTDSPKYNF